MLGHLPRDFREWVGGGEHFEDLSSPEHGLHCRFVPHTLPRWPELAREGFHVLPGTQPVYMLSPTLVTFTEFCEKRHSGGVLRFATISCLAIKGEVSTMDRRLTWEGGGAGDTGGCGKIRLPMYP